MPTNLTGTTIASTFSQLLHIDGGPTSTEATVYSGTGVATALKLSIGSASVDNIQFNGNTISTLDTNGNLILAPNGTGSVSISKVAITGGSVAGITDLAIADGGTGASTAADARTNLGLGTMAVQAASNVAITGGSISNVTFSGSFSGMTLVEATNMKATGTMGYSTGAGGAVTQTTSKSTTVTLNKTCGQITMHNAQLNRNTSVSFSLSNSQIASTDVVVACIGSGATAGAYGVEVDQVDNGSCRISLHNHLSGTDLSEAVVLNFIVWKAVTS